MLIKTCRLRENGRCRQHAIIGDNDWRMQRLAEPSAWRLEDVLDDGDALQVS